jgi:RNA polymerase sigma factor (sigma-70 family)
VPASAEVKAPDAEGSQEEAARKRAAVETYARHEETLRRQARRYSLCADDADDALQRALEILLRKAPTTDPRELIRWTQTVVKHEALAVRRERERLLGGPAARGGGDDEVDWIALIPAEGAGPAEQAERREAVARSREALQTLKPQELRALSLLAEGYSYREIGEITGFSQTKINRCLAEGRERFRNLMARSEDGRRCADLHPGLSAFCDGEASAAEEAELREHLRACAHCRATLRAYRALPAAAAALAPTLPLHRSLFERAHEAAVGLASRFGGGGGDSAISSVAAAGGSRGAGMAALAKILAVCAGTVGGAAACAATGVIPAPVGLGADGAKPAEIERPAEPTAKAEEATVTPVEFESATPPPEQTTTPSGGDGAGKEKQEPAADPQPEPVSVPAAASGAVEYTPPPAPAPEATASPSSSGAASSSGGDPSGEFGP